uniref:Uncharacterized protein n=1 Tax=Scleropages formosus TaxID=113540 RepID=A0A8C9RX30_SCLFO
SFFAFDLTITFPAWDIQAAWSLKTRALTETVYIDEVDVDQEGIAEIMLDESAIAQVARPGTSLMILGTSQGGGPSPAVRPVTQSGRPITGFVRPSTQSGRPGTMEQPHFNMATMSE